MDLSVYLPAMPEIRRRRLQRHPDGNAYVAFFLISRPPLPSYSANLGKKRNFVRFPKSLSSSPSPPDGESWLYYILPTTSVYYTATPNFDGDAVLHNGNAERRRFSHRRRRFIFPFCCARLPSHFLPNYPRLSFPYSISIAFLTLLYQRGGGRREGGGKGGGRER